MLTKIDKKILAKYYDRRGRNEDIEEEKKDNLRPDGNGNANNGKLINTK